MPERQYIPSPEGGITETELKNLGGSIGKFTLRERQPKPHGKIRRGLNKLTVVGAAVGMGIAGEGSLPAANWQNAVRAGSDVTREVGRIYRTKKQAEEARRRTEARKEAQRQKHEQEMAKIDAKKQEAAMEGAIRGGGEMEAEVSADGKSVRASTNAEKLQFQKEVLSNKNELVKIYKALKLTNGDWNKMWTALDKEENVSETDRTEIQEKWDEIVKILKQQGAIK